MRIQSFTRNLAGRAAVLFLASSLAAGCMAQASRGGPGTDRPDMDRPAMSVTLDRDDITYLVDDYLRGLEDSAFWSNDVRAARKQPVVAIWPIQNATSQHIDDQMQTVLASIETSLVNTGRVVVVDRSRQADLAAEIGIQQGAAFDKASAQRLGRQLGAKYFFTGKVMSVDERLNKVRRVQYSLFLQVLEIETGVIKYQREVTRSKQLKG
jgi:PBP1b-binding outer membrane lipoprotein LpoB